MNLISSVDLFPKFSLFGLTVNINDSSSLIFNYFIYIELNQLVQKDLRNIFLLSFNYL